MSEDFDLSMDGWKLHDDSGFLGLVGPVWERQGHEGPELATAKHENLRGS